MGDYWCLPPACKEVIVQRLSGLWNINAALVNLKGARAAVLALHVGFTEPGAYRVQKRFTSDY